MKIIHSVYSHEQAAKQMRLEDMQCELEKLSTAFDRSTGQAKVDANAELCGWLHEHGGQLAELESEVKP